MKTIKKVIGTSLIALMLMTSTNTVFAKSIKVNRISSVQKNYGIERILAIFKHKKAVSEEQLKNALYALKEAEVKLNNNYDELLKNEIKDENEFRDSKKYKEVKLEVSSNYENALAASKAILEQKDATREQKLNALLNLIDAKLDLTDDYKEALKKEVTKEKEVKNKSEYKNAKLELSSNYENALTASKAILEDAR